MPSQKKNILLFNPSFDCVNMYLPYFWASAKTYYERNGQKTHEYNWINPKFNYYTNIDEIKEFIRNNPPDIFGISLYVWNHTIALKTADWVRKEFPNCLIISGGPHQYFKHELSWFVDHPFLDASLAGDDYGELTMCDILDQFDSKETVDWNKVHAVVYPNKNKTLILQSKKTQQKRTFSWNYSAYAEQYEFISDYKKSMIEYNKEYRSAAAFETTRGCPYACTFCDWGGGTASKVVAKDMRYVHEDIDCLAKLEVAEIFVCDANFGILRDRDVEIMQYIADIKKKYNDSGFGSIYFSGYAKTEKALPYIKKILKIEAENNLKLPHTYKLSLQTLDAKTLKNIDRTDISFEQHLKMYHYLKKNYNYDAYAEIVSGLPGMTIDKFYHEINVFSQHDIGMSLYEWYLLPETPSYTKEYREQFKIKTVKKMYGVHAPDSYNTGKFERETEIVVSTYSYTLEDFKEMNISYSWYRAFYNGGFLSDTLENISEIYGLSLGDFIKEFYKSFYTQSSVCGEFLNNLRQYIDSKFERFLNDQNFILLLETKLDKKVELEKFIIATILTDLDAFQKELANWIITTWPKLNTKEISDDINKTVTLKKQHLINDDDVYHQVTANLSLGGYHINDFLSLYDKYGPPPLKQLLRIKTPKFLVDS